MVSTGINVVLLWILVIHQHIIAELPSKVSNKEPNVLILGAGMSGVTAAKTLHESGFINFRILEGSSCIGGRMKETQVGDYTVELGAMWIYGKGSNPIYNLAIKYNVSFVDSYTADWTVRNHLGADVTNTADDVYAHLETIMDKLDKKAMKALQQNKSDYTIRSALRNLKWLPKTQVEEAVEAFTIDFEFGVSPSYISGKYLYFKEPYETYGSQEMLVINNQNGFSSIPKKMLDGFMAENDTRLLLNKYVTKIEQSDDVVKVFTKDGSIYEADYVVVTFSLGVLQHKDVIFSPVLPAWKMVAIDTFGICPFVHIHLQFPTTFWDNSMYIVRASEERGKYSVWLNMNTIYPGSNIIQLSVFGAEASRIEKLADESIIGEILNAMQSMYRGIVVPNVTDYKISRWLSDPLFRGAYSYWPPGFTNSNMKELAASVGRIHFAGEYINTKQYGFIHSAYMSGIKTASVLIKCFNNRSCLSTADRKKDGSWLSDDGGILRESFILYTAITATILILAGLYGKRMFGKCIKGHS